MHTLRGPRWFVDLAGQAHSAAGSTGLLDALDARDRGPRTGPDLAARLGLVPDRTELLVAALVATGVLRREDGRLTRSCAAPTDLTDEGTALGDWVRGLPVPALCLAVPRPRELDAELGEIGTGPATDDLVVCAGLLSPVDGDRAAEVVRAAHDRLRPGGRILVTDVLRHGGDHRIDVYALGLAARSGGRVHPATSCAHWLRAAGFEHVSFDHVGSESAAVAGFSLIRADRPDVCTHHNPSGRI